MHKIKKYHIILLGAIVFFGGICVYSITSYFNKKDAYSEGHVYTISYEEEKGTNSGNPSIHYRYIINGAKYSSTTHHTPKDDYYIKWVRYIIKVAKKDPSYSEMLFSYPVFPSDSLKNPPSQGWQENPLKGIKRDWKKHLRK